jgi:hypothetical protein
MLQVKLSSHTRSSNPARKDDLITELAETIATDCLVCSAPKAGAARTPRAQGRVSLCSLPGTPLPECATVAHPGSSVTGLLSIVLPDWSAGPSSYLVDLKCSTSDEMNAGSSMRLPLARKLQLNSDFSQL